MEDEIGEPTNLAVFTAAAASDAKQTALAKKRQKQAEKAARRAEVVKQKEEATGATSLPGTIPAKVKENASRKTEKSKVEEPTSNVPALNDIAQVAGPEGARPYVVPEVRYGHIPQRKGKLGITSAVDMQGVHQSVQILGLNLVDYVIVGSNDRLVSMLRVFKQVIADYEAPANQVLMRHFVPHVLDRQVAHLHACRPLSVSQSTAVRWLKLLISKLDASASEADAKADLCRAIDDFIRDRSTLAHVLIAEKGASMIADGDVVLTYARSAVLVHTLRKAWAEGKRFRLVVIDDEEPLREGLRLARTLRADALLRDLRVDLADFTSLGRHVARATKVLVGAHAMMSNGALYSRAGTAAVCLEAYAADVPVIVLCESVKFSGEAPASVLDFNERAPGDHLLAAENTRGGGAVVEAGAEKGVETGAGKGVKGHGLGGPASDDRPALEHRSAKEAGQITTSCASESRSSFMYDLTPPAWIDIVVTEHDSVPATSIPILNRLSNEANEMM